jgi:hypothetical protein
MVLHTINFANWGQQMVTASSGESLRLPGPGAHRALSPGPSCLVYCKVFTKHNLAAHTAHFVSCAIIAILMVDQLGLPAALAGLPGMTTCLLMHRQVSIYKTLVLLAVV